MARAETRAPRRLSGYTADEYLGLVDEGVLGADDRVELLEGVIVVGEPQNPLHASGVWRAHHVLERAVGDRAIVRGQLDYVAGPRSVPEPDVAVVRRSPTATPARIPRTPTWCSRWPTRPWRRIA